MDIQVKTEEIWEGGTCDFSANPPASPTDCKIENLVLFPCDIKPETPDPSGLAHNHEREVLQPKQEPVDVDEVDLKGEGSELTSGLEITSEIVPPKTQTSKRVAYKCDVCGCLCSGSINLEVHKQLHVGETLFKCVVCSCQFSRMYRLQRHMRRHTTEKLFKCTVCACHFAGMTYLEKHMSTHVEKKVFKCKVCARQFLDRSNLHKHMKVHTGVKPFKCEVCNFQSAHKANLKRHMKTHVA